MGNGFKIGMENASLRIQRLAMSVIVRCWIEALRELILRLWREVFLVLENNDMVAIECVTNNRKLLIYQKWLAGVVPKIEDVYKPVKLSKSIPSICAPKSTFDPGGGCIGRTTGGKTAMIDKVMVGICVNRHGSYSRSQLVRLAEFEMKTIRGECRKDVKK